MQTLLRLIKSKTVQGAAIAIGGWLYSLPAIDGPHLIAGVGALLATAGIRDAIHAIENAVNARVDAAVAVQGKTS